MKDMKKSLDHDEHEENTSLRRDERRLPAEPAGGPGGRATLIPLAGMVGRVSS
jgi:hypothetical protein